MTIYVSYEPSKNGVWGSAIMDQNMTEKEVRARIAEIQKECQDLGIACKFQTADELLGEYLAVIVKKEVA